MMNKNHNCSHDRKAYADFFVLDMKGYPWICCHCGFEGATEENQQIARANSEKLLYQSIKHKFRNQDEEC